MNAVLTIAVVAGLATIPRAVRGYTARTWRSRRSAVLRPGCEWCPTCTGTGEYHHDLVSTEPRMNAVDPCPCCRGIGQLSLGRRPFYRAPFPPPPPRHDENAA